MCVLGAFALFGPDGKNLTPKSQKAQALLALVATSQHGMRARVWLCDKLWSGREPEQALANLRQTLTQIRKCLGPHADLLQADRSTVRIRLDLIELDLLALREKTLLQSADAVLLRKWGEVDFLEGIDVRDPEFEEWLTAERSYWCEVRQQLRGTKLPAVETKPLAMAPPFQAASEAQVITAKSARSVSRATDIHPEPADALKLLSSSRSRLSVIPVAALGHDGVGERPKANDTRGGIWQANAERRYLTVGLCDIVGSSALSELLDPETTRSILDEFQNVCIEVVETYGGTVVSSTGEGILFEFGFPRGHGNDAERALRASLAMVERLSALVIPVGRHSAPKIHARIGVSSGLVLIGPESTDTWQTRYNIVGEAANLAFRIQALAGPNEIIATRETLDLVEGLFEVQSRGVQKLKGFSRSVHAFEIKGPSARADRSHARFQRGSTKIIGRGQQIEQIENLWNDVRTNLTLKLCCIEGEAGVGKTRLTYEFLQKCGIDRERLIKLSCFEIFDSTPLYPIASFLRSEARLSKEDSIADKARKIRTLLQRFGIDGPKEYRVMESFLGFTPSDSTTLGSMTPRQRKTFEFELLANLFDDFAKQSPCVLCVDDAHWLDPSSTEFLNLLANRFSSRPVLVLLTSRRKLVLEVDQSVVTGILLNPLTLAESLQVATSVPGGQHLTADVLHQLAELSDGIPFYIEQLTCAALERLESWLERAPQDFRTSNDLPLPLAELLFERLDRVAGVQPMLRVASAFARPVTAHGLSAILQVSVNEIAQLLEILVGEGIFFRSHSEGEFSYDFRHALLRRACYAAMVTAVRHETHRQIFKALHSMESPKSSVPNEILAHHLAAGALYEDAAAAWLKAGTEAVRRSANLEAIGNFQKALSAIENIEDVALRCTLEIAAQASLIGPYVAVKGFSAREVIDCCSAGLQLCAKQASPYVFPFLYARFTWEVSSGRIQAALESATEFISLAADRNYSPGDVIGKRLLGMALFALGKPNEAEQALSGSIARYDPQRDESVTYLFGANSKVTGQALLSLVLFYTGKVDEALVLGRDTLHEADELRHPLSTGIAIGYIGGFIAAYCGEISNVISEARRLVSFSEQHNLRVFKGFGEFFLGWASSQSGNLTSGIQLMAEAIRDLERLEWRLSLPSLLALLADTCVSAGRLGEARQICARAHTMMAEGGERWGESEVYRIEALVAYQTHPRDPALAEIAMRRAIAAARKHCSPTFELRALISAKEIFQPAGVQSTLIERRLSALGRMISFNGLFPSAKKHEPLQPISPVSEKL
jgi:class 3 adenylate cyclase/tetratricopeptide (TPR) repeat protein